MESRRTGTLARVCTEGRASERFVAEGIAACCLRSSLLRDAMLATHSVQRFRCEDERSSSVTSASRTSLAVEA